MASPEQALAREVTEADLLADVLHADHRASHRGGHQAEGHRQIRRRHRRAIDIPAVMARGIPAVNVPEYAEETVAKAPSR